MGLMYWIVMTDEESQDRDRNDSGRYVETYPDADFLRAIVDMDGLPGTGEIATAVECSHDLARRRLRALEDEGLVQSETVGNAVVWSLTEDGETDE